MFRIAFVTYLAAVTFASSSVSKPETSRKDFPRSYSKNKIIGGGNQVDIKAFPYQVAIEYISVQFCGGSIITPKHILSSGRCFENYGASEIKIRYGSGEQFDPFSPNVVKPSKITVHPKYSSTEISYLEWANDYDVAVIELEEEIFYSEVAQPVKLADIESEPGSNVTIFGWGYLEQGLWPPPCLHALTHPLLDRADCAQDYIKYYSVTDRMICAESGQGACDGDRGGPVISDEPGEKIQIGIISWNLNCAKDHPDVYTNIAHPEIRNFIRENTVV